MAIGAKANPKLIGAFALGAIALLVIGIIAIGGGKLFRQTIPIVMYFPRSVAGLNVGAPVNFRGVKLGEVTNIFLGFDPKSRDVIIPVFAELFPQSIVTFGELSVPTDGGPQREILLDYIKNRGLRAQLTMSSLVTGQLVVNFDFFPYAVFDPESEALNIYPDRIQVPTIPSTLEEVQATLQDLYRKLEKLPLDEMVADARAVLQGMNRLVNSKEVSAAIDDLSTTMSTLRRTSETVESKITPLVTQVESTVVTADSTLRSIRARADDGRTIVAETDKTLADFRETLASMQSLIKNANSLITPNSPLNYELINTLREASAAARSLSALAKTLERTPNAVIFGRVPPEARRP